MANEYLKVQEELKWLSRYEYELVQQLERTREQQRLEDLNARRSSANELQRSVEEYVQLQNEKESLVQLHRSLREQLAKFSSQQQQQHQHAPDRSRSPPLPDDGWVVLSRT